MIAEQFQQMFFSTYRRQKLDKISNSSVLLILALHEINIRDFEEKLFCLFFRVTCHPLLSPIKLIYIKYVLNVLFGVFLSGYIY